MKWIRIILTALLAVCILPFSAVRAEEEIPGFSGNSFNRQNYDVYAKPVTSNLIKTDKGWMIVNAVSGQDISAVYYDDSYIFQSQQEINDGLPLFGGFFAGSDGNYYIVTGQRNDEQSDEKEVYRITKYDSSWKKTGSASLYGANTTGPFDAGSCRMAMDGKYLLVRTCHTMYASSDGLNHQANVAIQVDTSSMTVTDSFYSVMNINWGYVSHSFNQFVLADDDHMVAMDHGDAYPRGAAVIKYNKTISSGTFMNANNTASSVNLITFAGGIGANTTNASLGGFKASSTHYLAAGNSSRQEDSSQATRNIFVAGVDKDSISSELYWLTDLSENGTNTLSTPHLVDLGNDTFMVLWSTVRDYLDFAREGDISWTIVDHTGKPTGSTSTQKGILSDCVPAVSGNKVIWYVYSGTSIVFYEIDLNTGILSKKQAKTKNWIDVQEIIYDNDVIVVSPYYREIVEASVYPENASDPSLYYSTDDESIAIVGTNGYVWAQSPGETMLHIMSANGVRKDVLVASLSDSISARYLVLPDTMYVGDSRQWSFTVSPEDAKKYLRFKSSDPSVISITEDGTMTALKPGTAIISAKIGRTNPVYTITVLARDVTSLTVTPSYLALKPGETAQLNCEILPENATYKTITWSSSDTSIVKVDQNGKVTAGTKEGKAVITASNSGSGLSDTCEVTVASHIHDYELKSWTWASDYSSATARFVCRTDSSHTADVGAEITGSGTEPSCLTAGSYTYTAKVNLEGKEYQDSKTVSVPAPGHAYSEPAYYWAEDNARVTGETTCARCGMRRSTTVSSSYSLIKSPTCNETGVGRYTAHFDQIPFTDQIKDVEIEKLPHDFTVDHWDWSLDGTSAKLTLVCTRNAAHKMTLDAAVTVTGNLARASATYEGKTYTAELIIGAPRPEKLTLNRTAAEMATESTLKLTATISPADADQSVTWTSSDPDIAKVDSNGRVTALRYGKAVITAASKFGSVSASCTIQTRFYDVNSQSLYYYQPVYWAADNGITTGYDRVYFGPKQNCTRRELSIFLWRLAGKPAASGTLPFYDTGKYARTTDTYKAILWCYQNGIVKGYSDGSFRPDNSIVRKDTMIMLYRLAGRPAVSGSMAFADVRALGYSQNSDTYKSIIWGTQLGITKGYSDGSFKPNANCLREHIVTFVYRYDLKYPR